MLRKILKWIKTQSNNNLLPVKKTILGKEKMVGVDVGSAEGLQPHWLSYEGIIDFYLFEPHEENCKKLNSKISASSYANSFHILPVGLSEFGGERTLYILNCTTGSSLYPINYKNEFSNRDNLYVHPVNEARIQTETLNNILNQYRVECVDMIKLDVQGAELEILRGMGKSRREQLLLVEVEVSICTGVTSNNGPYQGAPTWGDIDQLLSSDGMQLLDLSVAREYTSKAGDSDWYQRNIFDVYKNSPSLSARVWEADVVYIRDWKQLITKKKSTEIRKLAIALCGYRFFSEAYAMIEKAQEAGLFEPNTANEIKHNIVKWHRSGRYFWQSRNLFWKFFRSKLRDTGMSQILRWKQYMWFEYPNG